MRKTERTRKRRKKKKKGLRRGGSSFEEEDIRGDLEEKKTFQRVWGKIGKEKKDKNREQSEWNVLERDS